MIEPIVSIIIVNYNVKYFLYQALKAVEKAIEGITAEVIVVDNASNDKSIDLVKFHFPWVNTIENKENVGFSKANNQGLAIAKGKYQLLLNPDTIIAEDTLKICIQFMDKHPDAGALGVRMIDGNGHFLPESKRGLPTPEVALYKMTGLARIFKKSKKIGAYHQSFLPEKANSEVPILSGAFMFMRKKALDSVGNLDETYFMYGEDIDLSYRFILKGFCNYYIAETTIVHYKGESTKKNSVNYVIVFYKAMVIFANQYFSRGRAKIFSFFISIGVVFRAFIAILNRVTRAFWHPIADLLLGFLSLRIVTNLWETHIIAFSYPEIYPFFVQPIYILIWILSSYFSGAYDKPFKPIYLLRGVAVGTLVIAFIYAFLPDYYRFSRAIIILGSLSTAISMLSLRAIADLIRNGNIDWRENIDNKFIIIGEESEVMPALAVMKKAQFSANYVGYISANPLQINGSNGYLGNTDKISDILAHFKPNEIVICTESISYKSIIALIDSFSGKYRFKIFHIAASFIIGSKNIYDTSDTFTPNLSFGVYTARNKRNKRLFDVVLGSAILCVFPIWIWFVKKPFQKMYVLFKIIFGTWSLIGLPLEESKAFGLKPGLVPIITTKFKSEPFYERAITLYKKNYDIKTDINLLFKKVKSIFER